MATWAWISRSDRNGKERNLVGFIQCQRVSEVMHTTARRIFWHQNFNREYSYWMNHRPSTDMIETSIFFRFHSQMDQRAIQQSRNNHHRERMVRRWTVKRCRAYRIFPRSSQSNPRFCSVWSRELDRFHRYVNESESNTFVLYFIVHKLYMISVSISQPGRSSITSNGYMDIRKYMGELFCDGSVTCTQLSISVKNLASTT